MKIQVNVENQCFIVEIEDLDSRPVRAKINDRVFEIWPSNITGEPVASAPLPAVAPAKTGPQPSSQTPPAAAQFNSPASGDDVVAPIPGVIVSIAVRPGQEVTAGQELIVLEAMKMKNSIRAPRAGRITSVNVEVGESVRHRQTLLIYGGENQ